MELEAGSMAFSLCGVPVVYRISNSGAVHVHSGDGDPNNIPGNCLGEAWSRSLFRRDGRIRKIVVEVPEEVLV